MSKKKTAVFFVILVLVGAASVIGVYLWTLNPNKTVTEFEKLKEGMKIWDGAPVPGISLYIPEEYEREDKEFYTVYFKDDARISLTTEEVDNDLANYSYYAVSLYEDVTDSFNIREEYEEQLFNTTAHVVEFDYGIKLEDGMSTYTCLTAYVMGEGRAYILTCVSDADTYSMHSEDFHKAYKTMTLVDENKDNE
ncbi:MAG: hypothetical protein PUE12_07290 [Oscillospiraceae bacterium]|nr:hypothetical protein [Oscillospiraceae bacterium]